MGPPAGVLDRGHAGVMLEVVICFTVTAPRRTKWLVSVHLEPELAAVSGQRTTFKVVRRLEVYRRSSVLVIQ